ncbi:tyrosine-type recombinase/integrase [Sphingobacterium detergens]|uniref:tyrosine-type recombinase/integrase n=1 Tax=Sphingobacterium detergens TaxID=1145106 RepID=UPI003AB0EC23
MKILNTYFWLCTRDTSKKTGLAPIKLRVSFGKKDEVNINSEIKVSPENWNNEFKQIYGIAKAATYNDQLNRIQKKVELIDRQLDDKDKIKTAEIIKNIYEGKGEYKRWTILELIDEHNKIFQSNIGKKKGYSEATLDKYIRLKDSVASFIENSYKRKDIYALEIDYTFIEKYVQYMFTNHPNGDNKGLGNETIRSSYYGKLRKIVYDAEKRNLTQRNPFGNFSMERDEETDDSNWLTMSEILYITKYRFTKSPKLERIRHRVVLALYTGLAYQDLETLHVDNIHTDIKGFRYIKKKRGKTGAESIIPIIPEFEALLDSYIETSAERNGKILPSLSNQRFGTYLTEMLTIMGINKEAHPHQLRHSFAQSSIDAGASVEAVAKMLGHKNTKTVLKTYAKLSKQVVMNHKDTLQSEMNKLQGIVPEEDDTKIRNMNAG